MAYEWSKDAQDNFCKFIYQLQPKTKTLVKKLERILLKLYRQNVSLLFNQTCLYNLHQHDKIDRLIRTNENRQIQTDRYEQTMVDRWPNVKKKRHMNRSTQLYRFSKSGDRQKTMNREGGVEGIGQNQKDRNIQKDKDI